MPLFNNFHAKQNTSDNSRYKYTNLIQINIRQHNKNTCQKIETSGSEIISLSNFDQSLT